VIYENGKVGAVWDEFGERVPEGAEYSG